MRWWLTAAALAAAALGACGGGGGNGGSATDPEVTVAAPCVEVGEEQRVDTVTADGARVAYAITYADGQARGTDMPAGTAEGGRFHGEWRVPSDVPAGEADVQVLVAKGPDTSRTTVTFTVAAAGGCP